MTANLWYLLLALVISLLLTFAAMPFLLKFCRLKGYYDMPNERKVHHNAIPRLGGVLFMPSAMVAVAVSLALYALGQGGVILVKWNSVLMAVGAFLVYIIGAFDDLFGMNANHKFLVQLVAALAMPVCGLLINNFYGLFGLYELPIWFSYPFTVFVILLIVNSINLIDGIDGLSSGLCICILTAYILLFMRMENTFLYAFVAAGVLGSLLAFFYYNMFGDAAKNRKTFMGDSGSLFLGYVLAYLSIKYEMNNPMILPYRGDALMTSFTLLLVPTFDVIRVALTRFFCGCPVFQADKRHIHHRVMEAGCSMHQAWCVILSLAIGFCVVNYAMLSVLMLPHTWVVIVDVLLYMGFHYILSLLIACRREVHGLA